MQVHFRGINTVKTLPMAPKDKDHKLQKNGIIYNYKCPHTNYTEQYIEEFGRTLGDRVKEHLRAPSPIHQHSSTTGHQISPDCFNIIHRETQGATRNIKEAMFIRVNNPSLNMNIGKTSYHISKTQYSRTLKHYRLSNKQILPTTFSSNSSTPSPSTHHPCGGGGNNIYFIGKYSLLGVPPLHSPASQHNCTSPHPCYHASLYTPFPLFCGASLGKYPTHIYLV